MINQTRLLKIGSFDFRLNHLLIIAVLILSFSISILIRSQVLDYGFELHEFDPFFNFRATEYLVENGLSKYYEWHDNLSWYPNGRDISATSQIMLHVTTAALYQVFGGGMDLYDFTILFPGIIGALTCIIVFALVRVIGGTTAGLFASLLFAVSLPIIIRGVMGWFKSEPLGLFYGLLGLYLFLSGTKSQNKKTALFKLIIAGIFLSFGLASWGGIQFFIIPIGMFLFTIPFIRKEFGFLLFGIPIFVISLLITTMMFERPGLDFVFGLGGFSLIVPTIFFIISVFIQKISNPQNQIRNNLFFLICIILTSSFLIIINAESEFLSLPSFRYLNAINPFLTTTNPLVDSVSEHATSTIQQSFFMHSILMIFAGLGIWVLFNKSKSFEKVSNDMIVFALIFGLVGVYVSSAFVRLELFASIAIIFMSSIGLSTIIKNLIHHNSFHSIQNKIITFSYLGTIFILLILPLTFPEQNWVSSIDLPPTILNGGTAWAITTNDWKDTLEWIKHNTPSNSVIVSWWDYGYWITTLSERITVTDNATIDSKQIQKIAKIFLSSPDDAWFELKELNSDYVLVFVSGQKLNIPDERSLYILHGGGDESKKQWFMRIAEEPLEKYIYSDGISGTDYFWNETLLGKMFPFTLVAYVDPITSQQSATYVPGWTAVYTDNIKYPANDSGPLQLVYASPSFTENKVGNMIGVFIYKINENYIPQNR